MNKGEPYNYKEIVKETQDYMNSRGYQFWREQEAFNKGKGNTNKEWLAGYKTCLAKMTKAFAEIVKKHRVVDDGS